MAEASRGRPLNMTALVQTNPRAWLPLTPRGVALFAFAPARRLLLVQAAVALIAAATVFWFVDWAWYPTIQRAIKQLPTSGEIRSGRLNLTTNAPQLLAEGHFLAVIVDPSHAGAIRSPAQFQFEFGESNVRIISLFGYKEINYPNGWIISFNRKEVEPWWGAWKIPLQFIAGGAAFVGIFASWMALGLIYSPLVWLIGFFANRDLNWRGGWKLAGAALMPGALLMVAGIVLYGFGVLDLVKFIAVGAMHFLVGWIYCAIGPFFVRKLNSPEVIRRGNPFAAVSDANPFPPRAPED